MDFDGDGRTDILTGSISGRIHWYRRRPNGSYAAGETLKRGWLNPVNVGRGSTVTTGDLDDDGDLDLVVGVSDGSVFLILNEGQRAKPVWGAAMPLKAEGQEIVALEGNAAPCLADWDGDGLSDLLLGSGSGRVVWHRNLGTRTAPRFGPPAPLVAVFPHRRDARAPLTAAPTRSAFDAKVCVGDWNGDGQPDLVVGDRWTEATPEGPKMHGWVWVYLRE